MGAARKGSKYAKDNGCASNGIGIEARTDAPIPWRGSPNASVIAPATGMMAYVRLGSKA